jgi:predicted nucleotidyltransferase
MTSLQVVETQTFFSRLPPRTRTRLGDLLKALKQHLGDDLVSVMAHGSAVRGDFREESSDVDLIIVVRDDTPAKLAAVSDALLLARASARLEAIILHVDEIQRSADVFPLLYADIQDCHSLLLGTNPFAELQFQDSHTRLRLEQELREARIRLRRIIIDEGGEVDRLAGPLERKVKQLRSPLRALLRLKKQNAGDDLASVYRAAGELLGINTAPLLDVRKNPTAALDAVRVLLDRSVIAADAMASELEKGEAT